MSAMTKDRLWTIVMVAALGIALAMIVMLIVTAPSCDRDNEGAHRDGSGHVPEVCLCTSLGPSSTWRCGWKEFDR